MTATLLRLFSRSAGGHLRLRRPTEANLVSIGTMALAIAAFAYALRFGTNCPTGDEWHLIRDANLLGSVPWRWFLELHNEHRYPLGKLCWWLTLIASGGNFRTGMVLSVAVLATAAMILARTLRTIRGQASVAELLAVALLLNWGHHFTWLMSYQLGFSLIALFGVLVAALAATTQAGREFRRGIQASALGILLMLNGGFGVGMVVPIMLWVGYLSLRLLRGGEIRKALLALIAPILAAGYVITVTLLTPKPNLPDWSPPSFLAWLEVAAGYLGAGFGGWAVETNQVPGLKSHSAVAIAVAAHLAAVFLAGRAAWRSAADRPAALGLLAVLAGQLIVAGSIGWYRHGGLAARFVTPSVIGLATCLLTFARFGPRLPGTSAATISILMAIALIAFNLKPAYREGMTQWHYVKSFLEDVKSEQMPASFLGGKWGGNYWVFDPDGSIIARMHDEGYDAFRRVPPETKLIIRPFLLPQPAVVPSAAGEDFQPGRSRAKLAIPNPPGPVVALRLRVFQPKLAGWQEVVLSWQCNGSRHSAHAYPLAFSGTHDLIFVIRDTPTDLQLEPWSLCHGLPILASEWLVAP